MDERPKDRGLWYKSKKDEGESGSGDGGEDK